MDPPVMCMRTEAPTVTKPAEPPEINGRPALGPDDVREWFGAKSNAIDIQNLNRLAAKVNQFDLLRMHWSDDPVLATARRQNESFKRLVRIKNALASLSKDLLLAIQDTERSGSDVTDAAIFLEAVQRMQLAFGRVKASNRGREKKNWHRVAKNIQAFLEQHDFGQISFGNPASSGIAVLKCALQRLGIEQNVDQIFEALRTPRQRLARKKESRKSQVGQVI